MTVAELIEKLQKFPPDTRVVVCGFDESGYDDPGEPRMVRGIFKYIEGAHHCGQYRGKNTSYNKDTPLEPPFDAVLIDF